MSFPKRRGLKPRHGRDEAVKRLSQPVMRDKTSIGSLEWVSLDGRMQDFWVDWGDGRAVRPVMLALVDVATNYVLGWELAPSGNAAGTVKLIKRVCGGSGTQDMLLRDHGNGKRVLLGRDPDDFNAPAIAFDEDGRLICEGIEPVQAGAYGSVDGIRDAARNRKAARVAVAAGQAANDHLTDEELNAARSALNAAREVDDAPPEAPQTVVAGRFNSPLRGALAEAKSDAEPIIPEEFIRNRDTAIAAKLARGGKPA